VNAVTNGLRDAGLDASSLTRLEEHLRSRVEAGEIPGALTYIWRSGRLAWSSSIGYADVERQVEIDGRTVFRLFSMTKPIASVALMQCYERGLIQLDDPVYQYIPEWGDLQVFKSGSGIGPVTVPCQRPMTVADLLTHQSGVPTPPSGNATMLTLGRGGDTLRSLIETLSHLPLDFQPGASFSYGVSTDVVGYLVEVVSGQRFDQYLAEHVFSPLGMNETGFNLPSGGQDRLAALYMASPEGIILLDNPVTSCLREPATYFSGAGGLLATGPDYGRFAMMLSNAGRLDGVRILGRKTIELMTLNHLSGGRDLAHATVHPFFADYHGQGYGLGVGITLDQSRTQLSGSKGEYYWTGAAGSLFFVDPTEDLVVVYMTQALPGTADFRNPYRWRELRALIYAALE
jgi:CubicO group peptidase (beta-lactamase class C family)